MTKLETTLIHMARQQLSAVMHFLDKQVGETVTDDDQDDYLRDSGALSVLLELGHVSESGMGEDAASAMRDVEAQHAAAVRTANSRPKPL